MLIRHWFNVAKGVIWASIIVCLYSIHRIVQGLSVDLHARTFHRYGIFYIGLLLYNVLLVKTAYISFLFVYDLKTVQSVYMTFIAFGR